MTTDEMKAATKAEERHGGASTSAALQDPSSQLTVMSARKAVERLLGQRIVCTLQDGRVTEGTLVCVDRL